MIRRDSFVDFMTWCAVGGVLLFLVFAFATSPTAPTSPRRSTGDGPVNPGASEDAFEEHLFEGYVVTRVMDGDSMIAKRDQDTIEIRIAGIDCPEFGQPFFEQAKQLTEQKCLNRKVVVKRLDTDRYGRLVSIVHVGSVNLAEQLLRSGMAWHYKKYDASEQFAEFEQTSRESRIGLWMQEAPIPPWEYRATTRRQKSSGTP